MSEEAHEIDEHLRMRAAADAKRFQHLQAKAAARTDELPEKKPKKSGSGWAEKIAKMRETYPNAYLPWTDQDDATLKTDFQNGADLKQLSQTLGRHEGSIKMRLQKHFGEDVVQ